MNRFHYGYIFAFVLMLYGRSLGRVAVISPSFLVALDEVAECGAIFAKMCRDGGADVSDQSCKRGHAWDNHARCHLKVTKRGISFECKSTGQTYLTMNRGITFQVLSFPLLTEIL